MKETTNFYCCCCCNVVCCFKYINFYHLLTIWNAITMKNGRVCVCVCIIVSWYVCLKLFISELGHAFSWSSSFFFCYFVIIIIWRENHECAFIWIAAIFISLKLFIALICSFIMCVFFLFYVYIRTRPGEKNFVKIICQNKITIFLCVICAFIVHLSWILLY